ncbi:thermonuclease family protein [Jannaschia sp. Os4]|uniref:thermonuclease family protein n=1 Tax=Jannaschia sp. Os4 TaxID=2807617 RepID=UPI0019392F74|nr:thermonuclease family protein [Jannaschia sp. Os4]MBM2577300.1 thermonuclease family protein [Jannaschia sp. Os4]
MLTLRSLFVLLCLAVPAGAGTATGTVRVVDADTIDVGWRENMRLVGIDAPEGAQTCVLAGRERACGAEATDWARRAWEGRVATCRWDETDRYGRPLAVCAIAGGDIAAGIVAAGWALTYRDDLRYDAEEKAALFAGRGLHAYEMDEPHEWRAAQRAARAEDFAPDAGTCPIKGNISDRGRLYHLPGMRSYAATRISDGKGERWFCSEGEARAAGWRRAGGG